MNDEARSLCHVWWAEAKCLECNWRRDGDPSLIRQVAAAHTTGERHETTVKSFESQNFRPPVVAAQGQA